LRRTALEREIASKVVKLDDVVRNTPLVLKLVVNYNRQQQIHSTPDEMEFLDIILSKNYLCYSQSFPVADFNETILPLFGFNNKDKKICETRKLEFIHE
jgi:hypothetical protein